MVRPAEERFWEKVDRRRADECWPWKAARNSANYGMFSARVNGKSKSMTAHRFSYELVHGPSNTNRQMTIDHICNNAYCVNPAHLRVLSARDNILRGNASAARMARRTHCPLGHPLIDKPNGGANKRWCPPCTKKREREYSQKIYYGLGGKERRHQRWVKHGK